MSYNDKKTELNDLTKKHLTYSERVTLSENLAAMERDRIHQENMRNGYYNFADKLNLAFSIIIILFGLFSASKYFF